MCTFPPAPKVRAKLPLSSACNGSTPATLRMIRPKGQGESCPPPDILSFGSMAAPNFKYLCGKFIVFEGGEGSGKSTQVRMFGESLAHAGLAVLHMHDPGATRIGQKIREI